ncbi:MAG: carbon-nitrogen family hydrolase [Chloroflexi bacterium]|nr:carbon-nitrogen family hydrolase [Chloroflexota bacterium]
MTKVACIQLWHNDGFSKEERIAHAERLIDSAAGSDLILLPEIWNLGWWSFDSYRENSETLHGETVSRIAEKAKAVNAYILAGSIVERKDDSLFNTAVLLSPQGQIVTAYRKMHLICWGGATEAEVLKRGEEIVIVKTDLGVLGFGICYDLRFPELFRKMAVNHGVEIFLIVSAWPIARLDNWRDLCHARAVENLCYLVACNSAGINRGNQYAGHSAIVDPMGTSIASAGIYEAVLKGEIDTAEIQKARKRIPALENRFLSI